MEILFALLLGVAIASFANVLIYRLPRNINIVFPASFCPSCNTKIKWYDNIPIFSWSNLDGKCRHCKSKISAQYPAIELLGALLALYTHHRYGFSPFALTAFLFLINLLCTAIIDWQFQIIPHTLTMSGIIFGLILAPFNNMGFENSVMGMILGFSTVLLVSYVYKLFRGQWGMGGGDMMLLAMIGSYLGPLSTLVVFFVASFLCLLYYVLVDRWFNRWEEKVPFGPFLSLAAALMLAPPLI